MCVHTNDECSVGIWTSDREQNSQQTETLEMLHLTEFYEF